MNDFEFGNYLYGLRKRAGLSQRELADMLGITNKAVSKWEVGKAKPSTDMIRKLATLFHMNVDQLLILREEKNVMVTRIVITGGPCAGKTTAMSWIQNAFTQKGYQVLFVPETATELMTAGAEPKVLRTGADFQECLMQLQLDKEKVYEKAAKCMKASKVLIVYDRGALDNKAYMSQLKFSALLDTLKTNEIELRDHYDAVFHLVTAAKGARKFYTTANNAARKETPEEAAALDDKLISAWTGHPHFRIIDNSSDFETKMKRLITQISLFLGEPEPLEIERKFLIEYPDIQWLESIPNCQKIEICQTYLKADPDEEIRIRQRGFDGHYVFFQTVKRKINETTRVETESRLSEKEYLQLMMKADPTRRQIRKNRYCLSFENQYFEIDIYPFWKDQAIAEIELSDENDLIRFPKQIKVIKEVTEDDAYKNANLALQNI